MITESIRIEADEAMAANQVLRLGHAVNLAAGILSGLGVDSAEDDVDPKWLRIRDMVADVIAAKAPEAHAAIMAADGGYTDGHWARVANEAAKLAGLALTIAVTPDRTEVCDNCGSPSVVVRSREGRFCTSECAEAFELS